jgi:hypothetical protein
MSADRIPKFVTNALDRLRIAVFKWKVSKPILFNVVAVDFVVSGGVEWTLHTVS